MFCAISGEPPTDPVISKKSGLLYEARLIRKYIQENGRDPISGEELGEDDLIEVKANPKTAVPRPPTLTSIPSLLASLQNEYDAVMLELFTLKKSYDNVRQELAHALYANDSANRVVARLMYERDEARTALASIKDSLGQAGSAANGGPEHDADMTEANGSERLPAAILAKIDDTAKSLSSTRKAKLKRKPATYPQSSGIGNFAQSKLIPSMHNTRQPGVSALDVLPDASLLLTGGKDKQVQVYDNTTDKIIATLKGHTKEINQVAFAIPMIGLEVASENRYLSLPTFAVSASADSSVRIWKGDVEGRTFALAHTINDFKASVSAVSVHPCAEFFAAASMDGSWALYDLGTGSRLLQGTAEQKWTNMDIHPDGILMALGSAAGSIHIIDIRTGDESALFQSEATGKAITSLSFSENGYYLSSATTALVEIWDLRKLNQAGSIGIEGDNKTAIHVRFDPSAQYLAVVGNDVKVYANKTWQLLWTDDSSNTAEISSARWSWADGSLVTASIDRTVRIFSAKPQTE